MRKYLYAHSNPVTNWDPSGYLKLVEVGTASTISVDFGLALNTIAFAYLTGSYNSSISDLGERNAIQQFVIQHRDGISSASFKDIDSKTRRKVYLHYSRKEFGGSLGGGLFRDRNSWATDEVYFWGWSAKMRLSLFQADPPDAVYLVYPRQGFEPFGPTTVKPETDDLGRQMPGGGREFVFTRGSGGVLTVFGPIHISEGTSPF